MASNSGKPPLSEPSPKRQRTLSPDPLEFSQLDFLGDFTPFYAMEGSESDLMAEEPSHTNMTFPTDIHVLSPSFCATTKDALQCKTFGSDMGPYNCMDPSTSASSAEMRRDSQQSSSSGATFSDSTPYSSSSSPPVEVRSQRQEKHDLRWQSAYRDQPTTQCSPKKLQSDFIKQYDPQNPVQSLAGKRHRDQAELDKMRKDVLAVKSAGGACLWCLRTKKGCGADNPCERCATHNRPCFRVSEAFVPVTVFWHPDLPCNHARFTLNYMNQEAFEPNSLFYIIGINLSARGTQPCVGTVVSGQTTWNGDGPFLNSPFGGFLDVIVQSFTPSLIQFETTFGAHSLIGTAIHMSKLFVGIQWLAQARVLAVQNDLGVGRCVVFYSLIQHLRAMFDMSVPFCHELFEALRGPVCKVATDIDACWVALALYYKVADGVRKLQRNPMVARIIGPQYPMGGICEILQAMLYASWQPRTGLVTRKAKKQVFDKEIPNLQVSVDIGLEFWRGVRYEQLASVAPLEMVEFLRIDPHTPDEEPQPYTWVWPEPGLSDIHDMANDGQLSSFDPLLVSGHEIDESLKQLEDWLSKKDREN
ncbi:hypothetical protein N7541_006866 [Penicillium brevicompactum]|uniref:Zn(2)-C6 fungal-type domain-containing protein n=1 Tax=Penicillium brevicompactum TaxID=5074 RepID=A0A9W9R5W9_PENBR|nr:hypothetical protein N7541_006866 [Penicillium brevicompactum]